MEVESVCDKAEEASTSLSLTWSTMLGEASAQCASRLGIWSCTREGEPRFTPGAWEWSADELLAAMWGKCLLEDALEADIGS